MIPRTSRLHAIAALVFTLIANLGVAAPQTIAIPLGDDGLTLDMVRTPEGLCFGKFEVTQAQWRRITGSRVSGGREMDEGADKPVLGAAPKEIDIFLRKLNLTEAGKSSGLVFRLPTEEEWTAACMAGGSGKWPLGTDGREGSLESMAWYCSRQRKDNYTADPVQSVGLKAPNAYGLYDMLGNAEEMTSTTKLVEKPFIGKVLCNVWCGGGVNFRPEPEPILDAFVGHIDDGGQNFRDGARVRRSEDGPISFGGFRLCATGDAKQSVPVSSNKDQDPAGNNRPQSTSSPRDETESLNALPDDRSVAAEQSDWDAAKRREAVVRRLASNMVPIPGKTYSAGKYEVTQEEWEALMDTNPSTFRGSSLPVEGVSWNDCQQFIRRLNSLPFIKESGMTYRLPTREEWMFACKAGSSSTFCRLSSGKEVDLETISTVAWGPANSDRSTHPVGLLQPNAFGLFDSLGNVWEWTQSACPHGAFNYGGSWSYSADANAFSANEKNSADPVTGFRLFAEATSAFLERKEEYEQLKSFPLSEFLEEDFVKIPGHHFLVCRHEVPQVLWESIMGDNPSEISGPRNPVESIDRDDCIAFIGRLNSNPEIVARGVVFRLPTEDEWLLASQAGAKGEYCLMENGEEITGETLDKVAWFDLNSDGKHHPVGKKEPNAFGLYDIFGNVSEWTTTDMESPFYNDHGKVKSIVRGGCWRDFTTFCAIRVFADSHSHGPLYGLRLFAESLAEIANDEARTLGLANRYYNGDGLPQDYAKAVEWYSAAASSGNPDAQQKLGLCFYLGRGIGKNLPAAARLFLEAAEKGNVQAMHDIGCCYRTGFGVEQDNEVGANWLRKAAEKGHTDSMEELGVCYRNGYGVEQSHEKAAAWFRRGADAGNVDSINWLGLCYFNGQGVEKDTEMAANLFQTAAEKGHATAQYNIGYCYRNGIGKEKNADKALLWYRKAAEGGNEDAKKEIEGMEFEAIQ